MRVLVLGGGWFAGQAIAAEGLARGWDVMVFNRGLTSEVPVGARRLRGDWERPADVGRLAGCGWRDAVIDVAGTIPAITGRVARVLAPVAGRYVYVSTVSVYRDWPYAPVDESSPLWSADPDFDPGTRAWDPGCVRSAEGRV